MDTRSENIMSKVVQVWRVSERVEAEFLDVIGTEVFRVFLLAINSHLY